MTYNSLCVSPPLRLCVNHYNEFNAETQRRGDAEGIISFVKAIFSQFYTSQKVFVPKNKLTQSVDQNVEGLLEIVELTDWNR